MLFCRLTNHRFTILWLDRLSAFSVVEWPELRPQTLFLVPSVSTHSHVSGHVSTITLSTLYADDAQIPISVHSSPNHSSLNMPKLMSGWLLTPNRAKTQYRVFIPKHTLHLVFTT